MHSLSFSAEVLQDAWILRVYRYLLLTHVVESLQWRATDECGEHVPNDYCNGLLRIEDISWDDLTSMGGGSEGFFKPPNGLGRVVSDVYCDIPFPETPNEFKIGGQIVDGGGDSRESLVRGEDSFFPEYDCTSIVDVFHRDILRAEDMDAYQTDGWQTFWFPTRQVI
jgi:hypothetical protein